MSDMSQFYNDTMRRSMKNLEQAFTKNEESKHENIENLYTLKKVQSKVRDKIVPWIDFQSTSTTTFQNMVNPHSSVNTNIFQ